jgi:DNA topoisomerase-1
MKKLSLLSPIGGLNMRWAETQLVQTHPSGAIDPRTGKPRLRVDLSRTKIPRPAESLKTRKDTTIPLDDFMGDLPAAAAGALDQIGAQEKLGALATSFQARAESGGSKGREAIMRVAKLTGQGDYTGALSVARDFMGVGLNKGMSTPLDTLIKAGPYIGPRGGKWADPKHTIPWKASVAVRAQPTKTMTLTAYMAGGGSLKDLGKRIGLSKLPATGGKTPVDPNTVTVDLTGDIHSKAVLKWKDSKGRNQYGYTETFVSRNAAKKWGRVAAFRKFAPKAKADASARVADTKRTDRKRDAAAIVAIIAETGLRPGSAASAATESHYGISTLRSEHVSFSGGKAKLSFVGKSGKKNTAEVSDPAVVAWMKERHASAGDRDGNVWEARDTDARSEFKDMGGAAFKLKDFRTVKASEIAASELLSAVPPPPLPANVAAAKKLLLSRVRKASDVVAAALNNTPAVARKSYIMPSVIEAWSRRVGGGHLIKAGDGGGQAPNADDLLDDAEGRPAPVSHPGPVIEPEDEDEDLEQYKIPGWLLEDTASKGVRTPLSLVIKGRRKDYEISEEMYRDPESKKAANPHEQTINKGKPMPTSWVADEAKWSKSKKLAEKQGRGGDYKYIAGIYFKMGGKKKDAAKGLTLLTPISKGKTLPVGSIRTHGGKRMVKTAQGWKPAPGRPVSKKAKPLTEKNIRMWLSGPVASRIQSIEDHGDGAFTVRFVGPSSVPRGAQTTGVAKEKLKQLAKNNGWRAQVEDLRGEIDWGRPVDVWEMELEVAHADAKKKKPKPTTRKAAQAGSSITKAFIVKQGKRWLVKEGAQGRILGSSANEKEAQRILERHRAKKGGDMQKGKALPVGTVRTHGGVKKVKTSRGWVAESSHEGGPAKLAQRARGSFKPGQSVMVDGKKAKIVSAYGEAMHGVPRSVVEFEDGKKVVVPNGRITAVRKKLSPAIRRARALARKENLARQLERSITPASYGLRTKKGGDMSSNELSSLADEVLYEGIVAKADPGIIAIYDDVFKASELDMAVVDAKLRQELSYGRGDTDDDRIQRACDRVVCDLAVGHQAEYGGNKVIAAYVKEYGVDGLKARARSILAAMPKKGDDAAVSQATKTAAPHPSVLSIAHANGMPLG